MVPEIQELCGEPLNDPQVLLRTEKVLGMHNEELGPYNERTFVEPDIL